jgi:GT2 family glycosyltransferase
MLFRTTSVFSQADEARAELPIASVIIPNYNGWRFLPTCLDSLRRQTVQGFEIILVDNASTDGSVDLVAQHYAEVRSLCRQDNRSFFSGAVNLGIRAARSDIVFLLNNDTELDDRCLAELLAGLASHPECGMAAAKLRLFDRRDTLHAAGDYYGVDGIPGNRGVWEQDKGQYDSAAYVFAACAGAGAYRKSLFEEVGYFDEDFVGYCEDVDLGWRAQLAGYRCVFVPSAVIYHRLSATGGGPVASFYTGRNTISVIAKDVPSELIRRHWRRMVAAQARITWAALRAWRGEAARARLRGQLAGLLSIPRTLSKRRAVQATRRVDLAYLESVICDA